MIEVKNLSGGYDDKVIVRDVSLMFPDGKITVIVGPNGSGKSTLLNLCRGELSIAGGGVFVDGFDVSSLPRVEIARKIAFLPQSRAVPDITVGALVLHGRFPWLGYPRVYRSDDKTAAEDAMVRLGIADKKNELLARLSGGERQKAYLAMLLAQNANNVMLDEPTVYLDIARQLELFALMRELRGENRCVVAVLHDLSAAIDVADFIAVMFGGAVLGFGTPSEVLGSGALEQAFGVRAVKRERVVFEAIIDIPKG